MWVVMISEAEKVNREVVLLVDSSESMSLTEEDGTRYEKTAQASCAKPWFPALNREKIDVRPYLFGGDIESADAKSIAGAKPDRPATDLGGAIARGIESNPHPLAVIALTDGVSNVSDNNNSALGALVESGTPFIGVGIGRDTEVTSISLRNVTAPETAPPKQNFRVCAQLQAVTSSDTPAFDLLLMRDGKLAQTRKITPNAQFHGSGRRIST